jgi:vanillate O-demethylase ferredoxin subunit
LGVGTVSRAVTTGVATVQAREQVASRVVLLTLRPSVPVIPPPPGSRLEVTVELPSGPETRSYSLVDLGLGDDLLRIAVRLEPAGRGGSSWMHSLRPGDELAFRGPVGTFSPYPGIAPTVLLAAGIGITPVLGLARGLRERGVDYRIVYAGRSRKRMAFVDHLRCAHPGRVEVIESEVGRRVEVDALVNGMPAGARLYVCGPTSLLNDVRRAWRRAGRPPGLLRFEVFEPSGSLPSRPFTVVVPRQGVVVDVPVGTTVLDALEEAGVEMLYNCLRGECGLCRVRILRVDGAVDHRDVCLSEQQRAQNSEMCACVSRVAGREITLDC